jgi:hypothetical protein
MKQKSLIILAVLAAFVTCIQLDARPTNVGVRVQRAQGVEVSLDRIGGVTLVDVPDLVGAVADQEYDDGYVRQDSYNSGIGNTWNWGYDDSSQVSGNVISYSLGTSTVGASRMRLDNEKDFGLGVHFDTPLKLDGGFPLILTYGLNWIPIEARSNEDVLLGSQSIRDDYTLQTGIVPPAPHSGRKNFPNSTISLTPDRVYSMNPGSHLLKGTSKVDGNILQFTIGGRVEHELSPRLHVSAEAALLASHARVRFSSDYEITKGGATVGNLNESNTTRTTSLGATAGASLSFDLNEQVSAYIGYSRIFSRNVSLSLDSGARASIDMGDAYILAYGINYVF